MLTDLYIKRLEAFIETIRNKGEETYLYMTYKELIAERDAVIEALRKYESGFSMDNDKPFFELFPDPDVMYRMQLDSLAFFSKLIYHKHFSLDMYKEMQRFGESLPKELLSENDKIIEMVKKNPKISYIDILKTDFQLKVALDVLIENGAIYRVGKDTNTYWKINKQ